MHNAAQVACNPGNLSGCQRKRGIEGVETNTTDDALQERNYIGEQEPRQLQPRNTLDDLESRQLLPRDTLDIQEFRQFSKRTDLSTMRLQRRQLQIIIDIFVFVMDFLSDPIGGALRSIGAALGRSSTAAASEDVDSIAADVAAGKPSPIRIVKTEAEAAAKKTDQLKNLKEISNQARGDFWKQCLKGMLDEVPT